MCHGRGHGLCQDSSLVFVVRTSALPASATEEGVGGGPKESVMRRQNGWPHECRHLPPALLPPGVQCCGEILQKEHHHGQTF
mmetsp:Transcript_82106/g.216571  ORF Transcript_82106/g.216571 Transcript_82106/m.216571 type:complete len:82 (-) Transcript_82106:300-545(-)